MGLAAWNRKLSVLSARHKEGKVIWWARPGFNSPDYRHLDPKFHKFKDRKEIEGEPYNRLWVAPCGYEFTFSEALLHEYPKIRAATPPPVAQRCRKCNR